MESYNLCRIHACIQCVVHGEQVSQVRYNIDILYNCITIILYMEISLRDKTFVKASSYFVL